MKQGDIVIRKSYGGDIIFKIEWLSDQYAVLKGIDFRLLADAPIDDLDEADNSAQIIQQLPSSYRSNRKWMTMWRKADPMTSEADWFLGGKRNNRGESSPADSKNKQYFDLPGKVLHLDGDREYLRKSMELYQQLNVSADGFFVKEENMPEVVSELLPRIRPDILVITGHDGIHKQRKDLYSLSSYKNSQHFVNAVRLARRYERNRDGLIIVAGACQSHFEALLQSGANFASSPARVLIHALDPLYIAAKAAFTSINRSLNVSEVINRTFSGIEGLGGIETRGTFRKGMPRFQNMVKEKYNGNKTSS